MTLRLLSLASLRSRRKDPDTFLTPHGFEWSRAAYEFDLIIVDCFIKGKFADFSEELQNRMEAAEASREEA